MHLVMAGVNSFSVFLLSLKQQQNLMKIMFFYIYFPIWPYLPKIMIKKKKKIILVNYGLTGMGES